VKICVVIPLYNKEASIQRAMHSVLNQSHTDFELIVVDDGSTDNSVVAVQEVKDPRVRLIRQPNGGVSAARNAGVSRADSDWVAFLDADDEYRPLFLERIIELILRHPENPLSFVGSDYTFNDAATRLPKPSGIYNYAELFRYQRSPVSSSSFAVNKEVFERVGGYKVGLAQFEDWLLYFKLGLVGDFGYICEALSVYHTDHVAASLDIPADKIDRYANDLLRTMEEFLESEKISGRQYWAYRRAANGFTIAIAHYLARMGSVRDSIAILKYVRPWAGGFHIDVLKRTVKLILCLTIPKLRT
jgi:glycosyltransferase involved in cell wall biosynthesis